MGYFDDIVSKFSANKSYFRIGYFIIDENEKKNPADRVTALILKYIKKVSLPQLSEFRYIENGHDIHAVLKHNNIVFKINRIDNIKDYIHSSENYFNDFVNKFETDDFNLSDPNELIILEKGHFEKDIFYLKNLITQKVLSMEKEESFTPSSPNFLNNAISFAPIRTRPKPVYEGYKEYFSSEGEHVPFLLRSIFDVRSRSARKKELKKFIEDFGKESGLFESITIKRYGREKTSPFEINIILNDRSFKIATVGYGVSQVLPILTDAIVTPGNYWLLIQQPEIHLHPKAQASTGELIYKLNKLAKKKFIIETHSDYLIDRFRYFQSQEQETIDAQVVFFLRTETGNEAFEINIERDGKYSSDQPDAFKEFFIREQLKILEI